MAVTFYSNSLAYYNYNQSQCKLIANKCICKRLGDLGNATPSPENAVAVHENMFDYSLFVCVSVPVLSILIV